MYEKNNKTKYKIIGFFGKYWIIILILVLALGASIAGVQIYRDEVKDSTSQIKYEEQGVIFLATEPIDTLNPALSKSADIYDISKLIYEPLFAYDENMEAMPNLVDKFTVNTDRAGIEITLRDDIHFSDGSKLTNQDVINSITALKNAGMNSPYYDKVVKITQYYVNYAGNLAIWFRNNYQCSLDDLTFPIFKSNKYSTYQLGTSKTAVPIGTGIYKYGEYDKYNSLELVPNDNYRDELELKKLVFNIIPDKEYASNLSKINEVTCYLDKSDTRKSKAVESDSKVYDIISNDVDFLVLNSQTSEHLSSKEFRQAIVDALDFNKILENAYLNDGVLTDTIYYPNFYGVSDTLENVNSNTESALELLNKLGYKDSNNDRYFEDKLGEKISLNILVNKNNSVRTTCAKLIKKQLDALGIWSEVQILDKDDYEYQMSIRNFDILVTGYEIGEEYDLRFLFSGENPWYFYDYKLLTYARNLDRFFTVEDYQKYYRELKAALLEENIYVPLCYKKMSIVGVSTFEAEELPQWNNPYKNINTWSWKLAVVDSNQQNENSK